MWELVQHAQFKSTEKKNVGHGTPYITYNATVTYNATDSVICSPGYKSYATRVITSPALVSCVFCWIAR